MSGLRAAMCAVFVLALSACGHTGAGYIDGGDGEGCIDVDTDGSCRTDDCDDQNPDINPGRVEICHNGLDDNCDGYVDEGCTAGTTSYFVDKDSIGGPCADSNPGTAVDAPWCTIGKANNRLTAGTTVYIRAGTYQEPIQPANSGLADRRITYTSYNGEGVTITGSTGIYLNGKSHISVIGIGFYGCNKNLYISASDHNNIGYCTFDTPGVSSETWAGSVINRGSHHNIVYKSNFVAYGEDRIYGGGTELDDWGADLDIGTEDSGTTEDKSDYNLVIGNVFSHGGHHSLGVYSSYNVIRNNIFHNEEYFPCNKPGGKCGNRNIIMNTGNPAWHVHNVVEGNLIILSGMPPESTQGASAGLDVRTQHNIIRRNLFYDNDSGGVAISGDPNFINDGSHSVFYHNVFFHNGWLLDPTWNVRECGFLFGGWNGPTVNPIHGVVIKNNIFHENNTPPNPGPGQPDIEYYLVDPNAQIVTGNFYDSVDGNPLFVRSTGTASPTDFGVFDFHLQASSPCINKGGFLARATNDGLNSTLLTVDNADYFSSGNDVVLGDLIQFEGQTAVVRIVAVDYDTKTITLDAPWMWSIGTGVSQPYQGTAPDQGAFEY